jgi:hypothetical protein
VSVFEKNPLRHQSLIGIQTKFLVREAEVLWEKGFRLLTLQTFAKEVCIL